MRWAPKLLFVIVAAAFVVVPSHYCFGLAEALNSTPVTYIWCQNRKNVRTIRVEKSSTTTNCLAYYTRDGVDRKVGYGRYLASCNRIAANIKSNLEKASWVCRDVQSVTMTSSVTSSVLTTSRMTSSAEKPNAKP